MFECGLSGILLKRLLESLKDICTDVNLECSQHGIVMQAMDNSHVALVHLQLPIEFFTEYRCDMGCVLGVNIPHMLKVLNIVKDSSEVFLSKTDNEDEDMDLLRIAIYDAEESNQASNDYSKRAETLIVDLKMVDMEKEHLEIPEPVHACTCTMKSKKFQEIVRYMNTVGESIIICIEKQIMTLESEGDSIRVKKQFKNSINDVTVTSTEPVTQEFATRYLVMFSRASSIADTVTMGLSANIPLALKFNFGPKSSPFGNDMDDIASISFFLAPKIDEE